jgi:hypothetical protein
MTTVPPDGMPSLPPIDAQRTLPAKERVPEMFAIAGIAGWALLVRLIALLQPQRIVWGDEPFYLWLGRNWLTGKGYSFTGYPDVHHTPLYPLLSGLSYLLTRTVIHDSARAMEMGSDLCYVLFGVLLVVPFYLLAKEMYGRATGTAAVLLLAVYPAVATAPLFWGTLTEPPYYLFVYTGLWLVLLAIRRERAELHALAGFSFGLAYLTRPEAVAYVGICGGVLIGVRLFEKKLLRRATLIGLSLFAIGFLVLLLPYTYYVYRQTGSWMVSEKAGVTFVTCIGLSEGNAAAFDRATWGLDSTGREVFFFSRESYNVSIVGVIRAYPAEFVQLLVRNVRRFFGSLLSSRLFPYYFLPLIGLSFFKQTWDKRRVKGELLLLASLTPVLAFLLFFIQDRYIATALPTLVIWLGLGGHELGVWLVGTVENLLPQRSLRPIWRGALVGLPTLLLLLYLVAMQPRAIAQYTNIGSFRTEHKTVGLWMKDNVPPSAVVMSRFPAIAFYAERRWEPTPNAEYARLLTYARANAVDYFVLDEEETRDLRPQFAFLLDTGSVPPDLDLVYTLPSARGKLLVFAVK